MPFFRTSSLKLVLKKHAVKMPMKLSPKSVELLSNRTPEGKTMLFGQREGIVKPCFGSEGQQLGGSLSAEIIRP